MNLPTFGMGNSQLPGAGLGHAYGFNRQPEPSQNFQTIILKLCKLHIQNGFMQVQVLCLGLGLALAEAKW